MKPHPPCMYQILKITLLLPGCLTNDYSRGWSLGPRSHFQLIWTTFWTRGTIIELLIVKGVHQALQQLSKGRLSKETIVQETFVQVDSCPRRLLSKDNFCPRRQLSKETFFQGDSYINYCPRKLKWIKKYIMRIVGKGA